MGNRNWWQRTAATVCVTGLAVTMALVGAGNAAAAGPVDNDAPANQEPQFQATGAATQVYSITFPSAADALVTVDNNGMTNGATVNTWQRTNATNDHGGVLQANQLWEFVPEAANTSGNIFGGFGWLRNRQSGKCLQVMGASTEEGAEINQWDCVPGATNELWRAIRGAGTTSFQTTSLQVKQTGAYLGMYSPGCDRGQASNPHGNGESLFTRYDAGPCTIMRPKKEAYQFATNKIGVLSSLSTYPDDAEYRCLPGYNFRTRTTGFTGPQLPGQLTTQDTLALDFEDLSHQESTMRIMDNGPNKVAYFNDTMWLPWLMAGTGQVRLFCAPA